MQMQSDLNQLEVSEEQNRGDKKKVPFKVIVVHVLVSAVLIAAILFLMIYIHQPLATIVGTVLTWAMYLRIVQLAEIPFKSNILKIIAMGLVANYTGHFLMKIFTAILQVIPWPMVVEPLLIVSSISYLILQGFLFHWLIIRMTDNK